MKLIDFSKLHTLPLSASTLKFMQEMMLQIQMLSALGGVNYVLSGCTITGSNVSDGFVVVNGEVLPFRGGTVGANVVVVDVTTSRNFGDGTINPYYHDRYATFGSGVTQYLWTDFERNEASGALLKRMRLAEGLLTGLRTDLNALTSAFNAYTPTWASITGKPTALATHADSVHLGDVTGTDGYFTITIPNQGADNYVVAGSLLGNGSDPNFDNDVMWIISSKAADRFKIAIREVSPNIQDLSFDFVIYKI